MVGHARRQYDGDPERVFVLGMSSGAMMTNVLLARYPELFAAGAAFAGVPFGGFATEERAGWDARCATGRVVRTPAQWGDLVRAARPGHQGRRPRVQLWHSTADDILSHRNLHEAVKQWTDVHGVGQRPVLTDQPQPGWRRTRYGDPGVRPPVEAVSVAHAPHNVLLDGMAHHTLAFFGLA
jgi:poly(hydroxyalkanoate) depolymerase family esterase